MAYQCSIKCSSRHSAQSAQWGTAGSASAAPRAARSAPIARALRARARAVSLITVSRSALRSRREGAARLAPGRAAAGCHRRLALRARLRWHGRAARPGAFGSPVAASRCALGAEGRGRCAPGRLHVPPDNCACRRRRALRAARDARCNAGFESCRGRGWGGGRSIRHHDAQACGKRLRAAAACAMRVGATRH